LLNQKGVATFMVLAQHGVIGREMQPPVEVSYLADSVLLLRYFEVQGELRQAISMIHKRSGNHQRSISGTSPRAGDSGGESTI
jgi:circadian clock protein KaiC